jgi:hypothetical protein
MKSSPAWYLIPPLATALFLWPPTVALVKGVWHHHRLDLPVALLLAPAILAIVAAPGFLYAVFSRSRWATIGNTSKLWITASIIVAVLASVGAAIASIPTGLGPILSLWTLVMAIRLLFIFRKQTR